MKKKKGPVLELSVQLIRGRDAKPVFKMFKKHPLDAIQKITFTRKWRSMLASGRFNQLFMTEGDRDVEVMLNPTLLYTTDLFDPFQEAPEGVVFKEVNGEAEFEESAFKGKKKFDLSKYPNLERLLKDEKKEAKRLAEEEEKFYRKLDSTLATALQKFTKRGDVLLSIYPSAFSFRRFEIKASNEKQYELRTHSAGHQPHDVFGIASVTPTIQGVPKYIGEREMPRNMVIHHFLEGKVPMMSKPIGIVEIKVKKGPVKLYSAEEFEVKGRQMMEVEVIEIVKPVSLRLVFIGLHYLERVAKAKRKSVKETFEGILRDIGRTLCRVHHGGGHVHVILSYSVFPWELERLTGLKCDGSASAGEANPHNFYVTPEGDVGVVNDFTSAQVIRSSEGPKYLGAPGIEQKVRVWPVSIQGATVAMLMDVVNVASGIAVDRTMAELLGASGLLSEEEYKIHKEMVDNAGKLSYELDQMDAAKRAEVASAKLDRCVERYFKQVKRLGRYPGPFPPYFEKSDFNSNTREWSSTLKKHREYLVKVYEVMEEVEKAKKIHDTYIKYFRENKLEEKFPFIDCTSEESIKASLEKCLDKHKLYNRIARTLNIAFVYVKEYMDAQADKAANKEGIKECNLSFETVSQGPVIERIYNLLREGYREEYERMGLNKNTLLYRIISKSQ